MDRTEDDIEENFSLKVVSFGGGEGFLFELFEAHMFENFLVELLVCEALIEGDEGPLDVVLDGRVL